MAQQTKGNSKVTEYRKPLNINIGMIIFAVILLYVIYSVFRYATARHVVGYEVRQGSLSANRVYEGLALRSEEIAPSEYAGHINYYSKEKDRLGTGSLACTVDESGEVREAMTSADADGTVFTDSQLSQIRGDIVSFAQSFDPSRFSTVYSFKDELASTVQKITGNTILNDISTMNTGGSIHYCYTPNTGYIVYSIDGYEGRTFDTLTKADFDSTSYQRTTLDNNALVSIGDPTYKLETAEDWSIAIMLRSEEEAKALDELGVIRIRFLKNQLESWATITTRQDSDGQFYANLALTNSMITFCTDRFIDIELIQSGTKGLKIPKTALVDDDFFIVPGDFITFGTGGQEIVLRRTVNEAGERSTEAVHVDPYGTDEEGNYYLDQSKLRAGDTLVKLDSEATYTIGSTKKLTGVYNINKGFSEFRQVNVLSENEEYAIVKPDSMYGLREYDYIVLDAAAMTPDEFIYE